MITDGMYNRMYISHTVQLLLLPTLYRQARIDHINIVKV